MLELQNIRNRKNIKPANLRRLGAIEMLEFVEARTKTTLKECKSIRAKLEDEYRSAMALDVFGRIAARVDVVVKHSKQLKVDMAELDLMLENPDLILKDEQRATALRRPCRTCLRRASSQSATSRGRYARQNMNGEEPTSTTAMTSSRRTNVNRSINDMGKGRRRFRGHRQRRRPRTREESSQGESSEDDSDYEDLEWATRKAQYSQGLERRQDPGGPG